MKEGTRLYINVTNKCNTACPFCCMYSTPQKNTFMNFDTFRNIIDSCKDKFELQLEGGEPLIHPTLFLFIEYAISTKRCMKVIILSNGIILDDNYLKRFCHIANWYGILFEFKLSINEHLEQVFNKKGNNIYLFASHLAFTTKYMEFVSITFNVRTTHTNRVSIEQNIKKYGLESHSNIFYLQSYGKLKENDEYEKPTIVQNINNWRIYASNGECFDQDLIARSERENELE